MKLAEFYGNGRYVKKDKKKRFEWLQHAANNSLMEAQELVAECYEKGRGAEHNDKKAYQWYKRAAAQGSEYGKIKAKEFELFKFYR
jgi:TPR repeat protein